MKLKNICKNLLRIIGKISLCVVSLFSLLIGKTCFAVDEVNDGGSIQNSVIGRGLMNMIKDLTGTLQWIIPVAGVLVVLYYIFKIMTGDEQDQMRYKKGIIKVLVCIVVSVVAVTIVNIITKYF